MENEMQLVPYDLNMVVIEELNKKYLDVTIPAGDKAAYDMVMGGLRECRELRLDVDEWHKGKKKDINKAAKHYDTEKRRIHGLVEPIEEHLKDVRKVEDDRVEAEHQEKIRIEQERVDNIRKQITAIQNLAILKPSQSAADIQGHLDNTLNLTLSEEDFQEFLEEAQNTLEVTIRTLKESLAERIEFEKQEAERKAEQERLDKQRKEQEAEAARIKAEQDRIAEDNRKIQEERDRLEAEKRAEQERKEREEFERKAQEEARIKAEKEAKEKADRDAKEKEERERREIEEKARQEALKPDKEKIKDYAFNLLEVAEPELSQEASRELMKDFQRDLKKFINSLIQEAEDL